MGTFNVSTLAVNGKNGLGHAEILEVCRQKGCDVGLPPARRDGQNGFRAAGYAVYRSGSDGGVTEAKCQHGVGLAIKESILQDVEKDGLTRCGVNQCSTYEGATKLEGEIDWDFLCGRVRPD